MRGLVCAAGLLCNGMGEIKADEGALASRQKQIQWQISR